jgi:hypothetical protein
VTLIGYPDFDRPLGLGPVRVWRPYGGGPFLLEPSRYGVLTDASGMLEWRLELVRALTPSDSRATFSCVIGAEYDTAEALAAVRELDPEAGLASLLLSDETFRILPTPVLATARGLTAPVPLASSGLGTGRLLLPLPVDSGLLLESLLMEEGALKAVAEAQVAGISPRVPAVVRFDPALLLEQLRAFADVGGALPRAEIVGYFRQDLEALPLDVTGTVDASTVSGFSETMADRVVDRFGRYVPALDVADAPVVSLTEQTASGTVIWSLSQPLLARRRMQVPVDLLTAARDQLARQGIDSLVTRRDIAALPSLGRSRVTVLSTLPTARVGSDALGVTLEFPPNPPDRPQPRTATAMLDSADVVRLDVRLAPEEPLRYRYTPFAVVTDARGTRQLEGDTREGGGDVLRVSAADFPVELAMCEATLDVIRLAVVYGVYTWEIGQQVHELAFVLDSGRLAVAGALPRERDSLRIDVLARDTSPSARSSPRPCASISALSRRTALGRRGCGASSMTTRACARSASCRRERRTGRRT